MPLVQLLCREGGLNQIIFTFFFDTSSALPFTSIGPRKGNLMLDARPSMGGDWACGLLAAARG